MNQATNVNVVPSYGQRGELHFSQYDVGRTATINLYGVNEAFSIPASSTVKIQATKPSGLGFNESCTYSGNVVTVVSTETMTEEWGRFPCELRITKNDDIIGTANFMFCVEPSPHPDGTVDGDSEAIVNEIEALVLQSEGYALGTQNGVPVDSSSPYYHNNAQWYAENPKVISDDIKVALLNCFKNVAWINNDGQNYYDVLESALNYGLELISISAIYTQSGDVYANTPLNDLKDDLVVTAYYNDSSSATLSAYTLSGTLEVGTSTITVSYLDKTTTFNVTVSERMYYSFADGDLNKVNGSYTQFAEQNFNQTALDYRSDKIDRRRAFYLSYGEYPLWSATKSGSTIIPAQPTEPYKYPIPIPSNATSVTVSISPSTQYIQTDLIDYTNGNYQRSVGGTWAQGTVTLSFTAGQYGYIDVSTKYDSTGTSYPTEPSNLTITFAE